MNLPSAALFGSFNGYDTCRKVQYYQTRFEHFQGKVISALSFGKDCLVVHPTGSGKSLCFQFPPVFKNKMVIVVTPMICLIQDQVTNLEEKGMKVVS